MSASLTRAHRIAVAALLLGALAACEPTADKGPVRVDVIGTKGQMAKPLDNGGNAGGQVPLAAFDQGLVAFDAGGALIGALAERWIVEDDGQSYIFRLKRARWPNGDSVKAGEVAQLLAARFKASPALVAGLDPDVRGMTDEVLEIRLPGATPAFLQLLAHPALAIARKDGGTGPFDMKRTGDVITLTLPAGEATEEGEAAAAERRRPIFLRPVRASLAFTRFNARLNDLVLGGRFQHLPFVTVANPPNGTVRADPVSGLLGLIIEGQSDFLANRDVRQMLSMAINRDRLSQVLNLAGWTTATTILPDKLDIGRAPTPVSWAGRDYALRQSYARSVVDNWTQIHEAPPILRIALPAGPGASILYQSLRQDYAAIGLRVELVAWDAPADMRLVDEVAPFDSALWYLNRLGCDLNKMCSADAEARLTAARAATTDDDRARALGEAETLTLEDATYIPIGMPVRFSLVRNRLSGYESSPRGRHPLNALFRNTR